MNSDSYLNTQELITALNKNLKNLQPVMEMIQRNHASLEKVTQSLKPTSDNIVAIINQSSGFREQQKRIFDAYSQVIKSATPSLQIQIKKCLKQVDFTELTNALDQHIEEGELEKNLEKFNKLSILGVTPTRVDLSCKKFKLISNAEPQEIHNKKFIHVLTSKFKDKDFYADQIATVVFTLIINAFFQYLAELITFEDFINFLKNMITFLNNAIK